MQDSKTTFALFFGNRGFFPASLISQARDEMARVLQEFGHDTLVLDADATRYGAVESPQEGQVYANFLAAHKGEFGGVILCLPNFGDETGAVAALKDAGVPILVHAYPDDLSHMAPEVRRDAFCGKLSIMDVFNQYGVPFTALKPHVVAPTSERFRQNVDQFDRLCRVVNGMRNMVVGAIGARTTAFKTVRIDELALQRNGITMETLDLSSVFARMGDLDASAASYRAKAEALRAYTNWQGVPEDAFDNIVRLGIILDEIIEEYELDALALRCWLELQEQLGISGCVLLGALNNRGFPAACEVDVGNAVAMRALYLATGAPATCLDWNNNYADEDDKCILFHCGPVPKQLMTGQGKIVEHAILANAVGEGCSYGCHVGRIAPTPFTFSSLATDQGRLRFYLGQGSFTDDPIPSDFFGCAGVAHIPRLQDVLLHVGYNGFRHHVSVAPGLVQASVHEALERYLGFDVAVPQEAGS
jgi:L-fucose isomerase-like protein